MKKIVFILSSNFSGSHHLALMIGSHSLAGYVGEVKRLVNKPDRVCYICREQPSCELLGGIGTNDLPDLYRILYARLDPEKEILVDNSKKPGWAARYLGRAEGFDLRFIHLIRDPRALIRRWNLDEVSGLKGFRYRKRGALRYPGHTLDALFRPLHFSYALRWLQQNEEITDFLTAHGLKHRLVTYRDLALDPDRELTRLMAWLGQDYEPTQRTYWTFPHHGTQKKDYVGRDSSNLDYFDLRWQQDLSEKVKRQVASLPGIQGYLRRLGIESLEDGLTLRGSGSLP